MEKKKVGLYVALGTIAFLAIVTGAVVLAKKCEKSKNY
jgi:hypothetical protein